LPVQTGALPFRVDRQRVEILLVTGRRSGRWTIPKGWPMPGRSLAGAAAREAFEEAGVKGVVDRRPIGKFRHIKQTMMGDLEVSIVVHSMAVETEEKEWPERGQRMRRWFTFKEAAATVDSAELRQLILDFRSKVAKRKE
jgi:ADP-ribose pyrophosphatase YjhB (NUDIX family)